MEFSAQMIAQFLNGEVEGDPNVTVNNVSKIEEGLPGTLAFLANPKYEKYIYDTKATIVLVNRDLKLEKEVPATLIRVQDAYQAFAALLQMYEQQKPKKEGIGTTAGISASAKIGENAYIGDFAFIGENVIIGKNAKIYPQVYIGDNVKIGDNVTLFPGVKIYHECQLGDNCIVHANVVIGSDGFGFAKQDDGHYEKIPQLGNVVIGSDVEIGANVTIDRAVMGSTKIHDGVKLDNLVQIAHNVEVGAHTVIAAQSGIAGSSKIGSKCTLAGQVGIVGHIEIGDNVIIAAQSGVTGNVKSDQILLGSPATPISNARKSIAVYRNLPDLFKRINDLEKRLKENNL